MREGTTVGKTQLGHPISDRPFPWLCPHCLERAVRPQVRPHTAIVKHDGLEHHLHIPALEVPTCEKCGDELFDNRVDDQISDALRAKLHLLTPVQIRHVRKALDLSQRELAQRLKIASATISRWETGALIQSSAMDNYLRTFFAFPIVREALIGPGQDPNLGIASVGEACGRPTGPRLALSREPADPVISFSDRFQYAEATYGSSYLTGIASDVSQFGFFNLGQT